jgi:formylglycine-generating enzyme required for sulfatase activity
VTRITDELIERVVGRGDPDDDPSVAAVLADLALESNDKPLAASALDRACGLAPRDDGLRRLRAQVLDELAVTEHGLVFRYVPAGSFLMGSTTGDADERPVHLERLPAFWVTETCVTWADFCRLMGWAPPPDGSPPESERDGRLWELLTDNRVRLQYCETDTLEARDWHAHAGLADFGEVSRRSRDAPDYGVKPMVATGWRLAAALGERLSTAAVQVGLPTEREWERAARGGLIGARYAWGNEPPDASRCDFGHFGDFAIRPPKSLPPNGYGLYGVCGGVSEWTCDPYDALAYHPRRPPAAFTGESPRVLRGGCFTDDEEAVTVSFRMALTDERGSGSPTVGFRLVRRPGDQGT